MITAAIISMITAAIIIMITAAAITIVISTDSACTSPSSSVILRKPSPYPFLPPGPAIKKTTGPFSFRRQLTHVFVRIIETASGLRFNVPKSAVVPSRHLTRQETQACRQRWGGIRISNKERLLGLYIGREVTIDDQYEGPLRKFNVALDLFDGSRSTMPLPMRIVAANVFLLSLFAYQNGHFLMPLQTVRYVNRQLLRFLTRVPFAKLQLFSHVSAFYRIRVELKDIRLANVASLLSFFQGQLHVRTAVTTSLEMFALTRNTLRGLHGRRLACDPVHPADQWLRAWAFFRTATGIEPEVGNVLRLRHSSGKKTTFSRLYKYLKEVEEPVWGRYLKDNISRRGW